MILSPFFFDYECKIKYTGIAGGFAMPVNGFQTENVSLCVNDFEHFHRAGFYAHAAGDALGSGFAFKNHDLERACFNALTAADAELFVDHINALCILRDRVLRANGCALTALNTNHGFCCTLAVNDLDAGF